MGAPLIELHRTRDFGKKLNATVEFIKENFKPLFKSLLYISGPFIVIGSIFFTQIFSGFFRIMVNSTQGTEPSIDNMISMGMYGIAAAIFLILGGTAIIATVNEYIVLYEKQGNEITVNQVWERVKNSYFSVLGTMILYTVVLIASYVAIIIPAALLGAASPGLMVIVMIAFYVGMIYVVVSFSFIFIIRAYEKVGFSTAVSRCFYLIKSKWWSTFGLLLVTSIIQSVISSIFFIPWYANFLIEMLHNVDAQAFEEPGLLFQVINTVTMLLYMTCSYILYCIPLVAIAFQYFNLVEMKEARGLMSKIDTLGSEEQKEDDEEHY